MRGSAPVFPFFGTCCLAIFPAAVKFVRSRVYSADELHVRLAEKYIHISVIFINWSVLLLSNLVRHKRISKASPTLTPPIKAQLHSATTETALHTDRSLSLRDSTPVFPFFCNCCLAIFPAAIMFGKYSGEKDNVTICPYTTFLYLLC